MKRENLTNLFVFFVLPLIAVVSAILCGVTP